MSRVQLNRLIRDVEHKEGTRERLQSNPEEVLGQYDLTEAEREAVLDLNADALIGLGLNPILLRTLLVLTGVGHSEMYTHSLSLRASNTPKN